MVRVEGNLEEREWMVTDALGVAVWFEAKALNVYGEENVFFSAAAVGLALYDV